MVEDVINPGMRAVKRLAQVVIRIAGDSGDGIQLTGDRFTQQAAEHGNDLVAMPNFPAEIRAPRGTVAGVSSFQLQFADHEILTSGDRPDVLVAMNPAALKANVAELAPGATIIIDLDEFTSRNLAKAGYETDPSQDGSLAAFHLHRVPITTLTRGAAANRELDKKSVERCKNMLTLGLLSWLYHRPTEGVERYLNNRFAARPAVAQANVRAFRAGWNYGETTESFAVTYEVRPARPIAGIYRQINGNKALAYGLLTASVRSGLPLMLASYPITPASDILHELSRHGEFGAITLQVEDEIASVGAALGASYGGALGVTATSGPGLALKAETIGLAVMTELPLVVVDVQRGGPSTGLPTKTEQADLLMSMFGRNGESPLPVLAPMSPADCFDTALEAASIALRYRTPVILLSDASIANGSEPWRVPDVAGLPVPRADFTLLPNALDGSEEYWPYVRDPVTLARDWAVPGTPGLEHRLGGLEKSDGRGDVSYDPVNHERMVRLRQAKVDGVEIPDIAVDDPLGGASVLVVGWGSSYGPIAAACTELRQQGGAIAHLQLRHLNPLPPNLAEVLARYDVVVVPEANLGQLALILRARYQADIRSHTRISGTPFTAAELVCVFSEHLQSLCGGMST